MKKIEVDASHKYKTRQDDKARFAEASRLAEASEQEGSGPTAKLLGRQIHLIDAHGGLFRFPDGKLDVQERSRAGKGFEIAFKTIRKDNETSTYPDPHLNPLKLIELRKLRREAVEVSQEILQSIIARALNGGKKITSDSMSTRLIKRIRRYKPNRERFQLHALYCLDLQSPVRLCAIAIVESKIFQGIVTFVIFLSTLILAFNDPLKSMYFPVSSTTNFEASDIVNLACTMFFVIELLLKIIAHGLILGGKTYLADGWNVLDALLILFSLLNIFIAGGIARVNALRCLRAIRILKAIRFFPSLRVVVDLMAHSSILLFYVFVLIFSVTLLVTVIFNQIFSGELHGRCYLVDSGELPQGYERPCAVYSGTSALYHCPNSASCKNCWSCLPTLQVLPGRDYSFDNFGVSLITSIQIFTLTKWGSVMNDLMDSSSQEQVLIFLFYIMIGPLFLRQALIAVLAHRLENMRNQVRISDHCFFFFFCQTHEKLQGPGCQHQSHRVPLEEHPDYSPAVSALGCQHAREDAAGLQALPGELGRQAAGCIQDRTQVEESTSVPLVEQMVPPSCLSAPESEGLASCRYETTIFSMVVGEYAGNILEVNEYEEERRFSWFQRFRMLCFDIASSKKFNNMILFLHSPSSALGRLWPSTQQYFRFSAVLQVGQVALAFCFCVEMVVKVIGVGPKKYVRKWLNLLDAVVVITSLVDFSSSFQRFRCLQQADGSDIFACNDKNIAGKVFRTLRLIRLVKLRRMFPNLTKQVVAAAKCFKSFLAMCSIILITLFCFAVLGMDLLGGKLYRHDFQRADIGLNSLVFLRWPTHDLASSIPGIPAYVVGLDERKASSSFLLQPLYGAAWKESLESEGIDSGIFLGELNSSSLNKNVMMGSCSSEVTAKSCHLLLWADVMEQVPSGRPFIAAVALRSSFDNFGLSCLTVLQLFTRSDWYNLMSTAIAINGWGMLAYFFLVILVGSFVLLDTMTAIVIVDFGSHAYSSQEMKADDGESDTQVRESMRDKSCTLMRHRLRLQMLTMISDARWQKRFNSLQILAIVSEKGDEAVIDVLISKVNDSHATVRAKAVETLGNLVPVELGEAFPEASLKARELLHDPSRFVRESAAKVLSVVCERDQPSVLKDLVDASGDSDPAVRAAAITSLGVLASPGDSFVIESIIKRTHEADSETVEVLQACFATLKQLEADAILQQRGMANRRAKKKVEEAEFKESMLEKARQFQNFLWEKAYKSQTAAWKKKEQKKQAKMVQLMLAAQKEHLFDEESTFQNTPEFRRLRYTLAAAQVQTVIQNLEADMANLSEKAKEVRRKQQSHQWFGVSFLLTWADVLKGTWRKCKGCSNERKSWRYICESST
eukprot:752624-Hanusia_phi.AAC.3